jgi:hypothetical protein
MEIIRIGFCDGTEADEFSFSAMMERGSREGTGLKRISRAGKPGALIDPRTIHEMVPLPLKALNLLVLHHLTHEAKIHSSVHKLNFQKARERHMHVLRARDP